MIFIKLDVEIIPSKIEHFTPYNINQKSSFEFDFFDTYNQIIKPKDNLLNFDMIDIRNMEDIFFLKQIELDDVDPPNVYLEDFNIFNLDLNKISSKWEMLGFSYKPHTYERVIDINDRAKIVKFFTLIKSITSVVEGTLIIKQSIPNFIEYGIYDLSLLNCKLNLD